MLNLRLKVSLRPPCCGKEAATSWGPLMRSVPYGHPAPPARVAYILRMFDLKISFS